MNLPIFLTAYDPSDLPSASIDPLGFERGYLTLADQLLPGLTNVASRPRYLSVLCAGIHLAGVSPREVAARRYKTRLESTLRMERFWALANVLVEDEELPLNGIRGVTYAHAARGHLEDSKARKTDADYELLSRQATYGMVGIYATVASRLRLLDRKTFDLTPDLGERLAEEFLAATSCPAALQAAVRSGGEASLSQLRKWGERAHVSAPLGNGEAALVWEVVTANPRRASMLELIAGDERVLGEHELDRMARLAEAADSDEPELAAWIRAAAAYEDTYLNVELAFEHILDRAKELVPIEVLSRSPVLQEVHGCLRGCVTTLEKLLEDRPSEVLDRLSDVRAFLAIAVGTTDVAELVHVLIGRHTEVQRGKFDRGRRKAPWLEILGRQLGLTLQRIGRVTPGATVPRDIPPHEYRTAAAQQYLDATADVWESA